MSAKQRGGDQGKSIKKSKYRTKIYYWLNIFTKCFIIKLLQNKQKIDELKTIPCYKYEYKLISKLCLFSGLFVEVKLTTNAKSLMQVSPCAAAMQMFHASYMPAVSLATF